MNHHGPQDFHTQASLPVPTLSSLNVNRPAVCLGIPILVSSLQHFYDRTKTPWMMPSPPPLPSPCSSQRAQPRGQSDPILQDDRDRPLASESGNMQK